MSGIQTQGWDAVFELSQQALGEQLRVGLPNFFPSGVLGPGSTLSLGTVSSPTRTADAVVSVSRTDVRFVMGRGDRLHVSFSVLLNGVEVPYVTAAEPGQIEIAPAGDSLNVIAVVNVERADLQFNASAIPMRSDWLMVLSAAGLTEDDVRGFAGPVMEAIRRALRMLSTPTGRPIIPLSAPLPMSFRWGALVVTDSSRMESAFCLFVSALTNPPPLQADRPIHLQRMGLARTAVVVRNNFLLPTILGPALNSSGLFIPPPAPRLVFDGIGRLNSTVPPFRIAGAPPFLSITSLSVTIDDANEAFVITGTFSILPLGILVATGTATMRFGIRWDNARQTIVVAGVPATQDVPDVRVRVDLSALIYILSAVVFALIFGAIGLAGGPIGAVIGAVVGFAFGLAAANTASAILSAVATGLFSPAARRLVGTAFPVPPPLLAPTELQTQSVFLDDLVIAGRPMTPTLVIDSSGLRVTRRTFVSTSGLSTRSRLTWAGDFTARVTVLRESLRYIWTLGNRLLEGEGEVPVMRGSVFFRVDGPRCHLTTSHGSFLRDRLCVTVQDASGFRISTCRMLEAAGERDEIEELVIPPDVPMGLIHLPPHLIPDPPLDVTIDPAAIAQATAQFVEAIERGMGVHIPAVPEIPI